jgi:hypothetical protein
MNYQYICHSRLWMICELWLWGNRLWANVHDPTQDWCLMDFDYLVLMNQLKFRDVIPWATPNIAKSYDHENLWLPKLKIMMIDHIVNMT